MGNVSEWFIVFGIVHKMTIGFAVIGVINGVFIQETFKAVATDDTIMMKRKEKAKACHKKKISRLFDVLDTDKDGYVNLKEMQTIWHNESIKLWLSSMEFDV